MLYPFELRALGWLRLFYPEPEGSQTWFRSREWSGLGIDKISQGERGVPRSQEVHGGRYRIRTYDFHRVKVALYR